MPIVLLPEHTSRSVGSTSVIYDPCSLIKELVDNALDAGATTIGVEVSPNTLDTIIVKDNGAGIPVEGRELVCKPSCTSKLQQAEDLKSIAGKSLGFRGLAMSSIAEMCERILITTRTYQEAVGASLKFSRDGTLSSSTKTSHPVGTTVKLTGFLRSVPVRKQTMAKSASKTIKQAIDLLKAYALARPETRLSFKVTKGKQDSFWTYAPSNAPSLGDAITKIAGKNVMSQCETLHWPNDFASENIASSSTRLLAVVPKVTAELSKIVSAGQYISIDRRPMATSRGMCKALIKSFKSYLRCARQREGLETSSAEPFICMHLENLPGNYDVNMEPGKDDAIFSEEEAIKSLAEKLFESAYGKLDDRPLDAVYPKQRNGTPSETNRATNEHVSRTLSSRHDQGAPLKAHVKDVNGHQTLQSTLWQNMQGAITDKVAPSKVPLIDPWKLAKASPNKGPEQHLSQDEQEDGSTVKCPSIEKGDETRAKRRNGVNSVDASRKQQLTSTHTLHGPRDNLPEQVNPTRSTNAISRWLQNQVQEIYDNSVHTRQTSSDLDHVDTAMLGQRFGGVGAHDKSSIRPFRTPGPTASHHESSSPAANMSPLPQRAPSTAGGMQLSDRNTDPFRHDIEEALDYEKRKASLNQRYKESMKQSRALRPPSFYSQLPTPSITPMKPLQPTIEGWYKRKCDEPPEGSDIVRRKAAKRTLTNELPLETVPLGSEVHALSVNLPDTVHEISSYFDRMNETEQCRSSDARNQESPFNVPAEVLFHWTRDVSRLLQLNCPELQDARDIETVVREGLEAIAQN